MGQESPGTVRIFRTMLGQTIAGRYEILELLGEGGMARVYRARDRHLGREVAVKILLASVARDPDLVERFRREARSAATLAHPNIVQVFDFLETGEGTFLIMELVRGQDLRTWLKQEGPLSVAEAVRLTCGILAALDHAHGKGLIHRDISARNILLDQDGTVRVSDFGIARAVGDRTLTRAGEMLGSVQYISPEQARGEEVGPQADLYGVGVLLFEMLTGALPFTAESPVQLALKHLNEEPEPPSRSRPGLPAALDALVLTALRKDPGERFGSAVQMAQALRLAVPPEDAERTRTLVRPSPASAQPDMEGMSCEPGAGQDLEPEAEPGPVGAPRRAGVLWFLLGTAVLALLAGLGWVLLRPAERVQIPNLVGLPLQEARNQAQALGLDLRIQEQRPSEEMAAGSILEQRPLPGKWLARGQALYVVVCQGRELVTVPDLHGQLEARAREDLARLGLLLRAVRQSDPQVPVGVVIRQEPGAGQEVTRGTEVEAVISTGPGRKAVPDLTGLGRAEAEKILTDLGFSLVVAGTRADARAAEDAILQQIPSAGTLLDPGQRIRVVLSRGRQGLAAPDLVGKSLREAREIAAGQGFRLVLEGDAGQEDSIESQSPQAGQTLEGSEIRVRASQTATVPSVRHLTVEQAQAELQAAGLVLGEVLTAPAAGHNPGEIVEQDPGDGQDVPRGSAVDVTVADPGAPGPAPPAEVLSPGSPRPAGEASPPQTPGP